MTSVDSPKKNCKVNVFCFRIEGDSIEKATVRIFKVGAISILLDLKELCRRFEL